MSEAPTSATLPDVPRFALTFIVITVILDVVGIALIIPVLPQLIREVQPGSFADAAIFGGWLAFAYAFMQFIFSPVLGNWSDAIGRRPVLIFGLVFLGIDYVIMALAPTLGWLFIGRILAGAAGASFTTASAYIADISPPEKRAANFGLIGAAFGVGFVIGPAIGGLLGEYGTRLPFWAAAGFAFINAAFGFFILPESLKPSKRRRFELRRSNPFGAFKQISKMRVVMLLIIAIVVFELAQQVYPAIWPFWGPVMFDWSPGDIGLTLTAFGVLIFIAEGLVLRVLLARYTEHVVIIGSTLLAVITMLTLGFLSVEWLVWIMLVPSAFSGFANSAIQGLASNSVSDDQQGELSGAIMSGMSIVAFISPPLMTALFFLFSQPENSLPYLPGAPFLMGALICIAMFVPYMMSRRGAG